MRGAVQKRSEKTGCQAAIMHITGRESLGQRQIGGVLTLSSIDVTDPGIVMCPLSSTKLQLSAAHACPLPATEYGVDAAHRLQPLAPSAEVPVYPISQTEQAAALDPIVPAPGVV